MPECVCCGSDPEARRDQPGTQGDRYTVHYRCPDCGAGGYRVFDNDGLVRSGGPVFDGPSDIAQAVVATDCGPWDVPEASPKAVADGGIPNADRHDLLRSLERIADAQERQARAAEVHAGAVAEIAHDMMPGRNSVLSAVEEWALWLDVYRHEVEP